MKWEQVARGAFVVALVVVVLSAAVGNLRPPAAGRTGGQALLRRVAELEARVSALEAAR